METTLYTIKPHRYRRGLSTSSEGSEERRVRVVHDLRNVVVIGHLVAFYSFLYVTLSSLPTIIQMRGQRHC